MRTPNRKPAQKKPLPSEAKSHRPESDRRLRQADRLARVMRMLQLLLSRGRWNAQDIAAEQECSERTVYRDMQVLELAGIPLEFDQEGRCYRVRQDFRFPALSMTEDEALGQGTAAAVAADSGLEHSPGAKAVTRKLAASSPDAIAQILADASELVSVLDLKLADHARHRDTIRTIQWALVKRKQLAGAYQSPYESGEVKLQVHPYRLCLIKQVWYLVARPAGDEAPRTYRVARFKSLRMLDANSQVPDDFDIKTYFGNAWAVFRGERSYDVEIVFTPDTAATAAEGAWHHTQKVRKNKDGTVTLTFRVDGLNEIVRWVLGWGGRAKVIQPPELRSLILGQLNQAIEAYRT